MRWIGEASRWRAETIGAAAPAAPAVVGLGARVFCGAAVPFSVNGNLAEFPWRIVDMADGSTIGSSAERAVAIHRPFGYDDGRVRSAPPPHPAGVQGRTPMASKEMTSDIASLESEAETVLAEARAKASELLRAAAQEAARIQSAPLRLAGVEAECAAIVDAALEQSRAAVEKAEKEAELLKAGARGKGAKTFQALVKKIEGMVRGAR